MEHRWNKRFSAHKDVGIQYPGGRTVIGQTRNVSFGGLFVEFDTADLPPHALVKLLLPIGGEETGAYHRIPAIMAHRTQEGIGLLFCGNDDRILKYVRAWLEHIELNNEVKLDSPRACAGSAICRT